MKRKSSKKRHIVPPSTSGRFAAVLRAAHLALLALQLWLRE
jgi:hypothetical protein